MRLPKLSPAVARRSTATAAPGRGQVQPLCSEACDPHKLQCTDPNCPSCAESKENPGSFTCQ